MRMAAAEAGLSRREDLLPGVPAVGDLWNVICGLNGMPAAGGRLCLTASASA